MQGKESELKDSEGKKARIHERYKGINQDELDVIPALPQANLYDDDNGKRVAVYVRVSTDDPRQTSSYELQKNHYVDLINRHPGWKLVEIDGGYSYEDYHLKVNRYIEEHKNETAIWKLRNNIKLTKEDYQTLSDIFTKQLGSEEDYQKVFGDTPFGLLIRKIAKLEYGAAMKVFSSFINEQSLNQQQIVFVNKVIDYVVQNGYVENISELMKPPFDKPQSFVKLSDSSRKKRIITMIIQIKENALVA